MRDVSLLQQKRAHLQRRSSTQNSIHQTSRFYILPMMLSSRIYIEHDCAFTQLMFSRNILQYLVSMQIFNSCSWFIASPASCQFSSDEFFVPMRGCQCDTSSPVVCSSSAESRYIQPCHFAIKRHSQLKQNIHKTWNFFHLVKSGNMIAR